jgi:hypothetical protein
VKVCTAMQPAVLEGLISRKRLVHQKRDGTAGSTHVTIIEERNGGPYSKTKRLAISSAKIFEIKHLVDHPKVNDVLTEYDHIINRRIPGLSDRIVLCMN